jgi:rhodanese-related sulfurtransferase
MSAELSALVALLLIATLPATLNAQEQASIFHATSGSSDAGAPEISTAELHELLAAGNAVVLDARPHLEWAISHIPGARNVSAKPGVPMSLYVSDVAEVDRLLGGVENRRLVLYCNGPFCGKAKRLAEQLIQAGYEDVRRYQLGAPVWRALGGVMVIEPDGVRYVYEKDGTAVFIDARDPEEYGTATLPGARNLPRSKVLPGKDVGEVKAAKDDGRLPMKDHTTRIVVFGSNAVQAKAVADAIAREAFHNVTYFANGYEALQTLAERR